MTDAPKEPKIGLAAFYNAIFAGRGFQMAPHHYPIVQGLEDQRIENLLFLAPPGTGKSNLMCTAYPLYELSRDPSTTIISVSAGEGLPQTFMQSAMQIIQHNKVWKELFPDITPAQDMGWSLQRGLFVNGHHPEDENASYIAAGLSSKRLIGLHSRLMIMDDVHDRENSNTVEGRQGVKNAYYDTLVGRADPRGVRRVAAGRWWAEDDLYQEWINSGDWVVLELPAVRPGQKKLWFDVYVPKGLECVYSALPLDPVQDRGALYTRHRAYYAAADTTAAGFYWPASPSKRKEYETVARRQPRTAAVNYRGDMSGGNDSVFNDADFRRYMPPDGLQFGIAHGAVRRWTMSMKGEVEDAWDTAHGKTQSESQTASVVGLMVPCQQWHNGEDPAVVGPCDFHYDVYLLDLYVGSPDFGRLLQTMRERHGLWFPRRMNVEDKQSGISLLQVARSANLPLHPIKVVEGKLERAINPVLMGELPIGGGAASVQGWAKMGRVLVPEGATWVEGFLEKICAYSGGTRATDEFDALVHLVTRAILRSRKTGRIGRDTSNDISGASDPALAALGAMAYQQDNPHAASLHNPFQGFCGGGCHWMGIVNNRESCTLHRRDTTAFDGCGQWAQKGTVPAAVLERMAIEQEHDHADDE